MIILPDTNNNQNTTNNNQQTDVVNQNKEALIGTAVLLGLVAVGGGLLYWAYK